MWTYKYGVKDASFQFYSLLLLNTLYCANFSPWCKNGFELRLIPNCRKKIFFFCAKLRKEKFHHFYNCGKKENKNSCTIQ